VTIQQKPLEQAVTYLESVTSPFGLNMALLKAGMVDLVKRLEAVEALTAQAVKHVDPD